MNSITSKTLLEQVRNPENEPAWSRFYDLYSPLIFNCARKKGCSTVLAEDVVQDTMSRLWRLMPKFRYDSKEGRFRSYLVKIVSSVIWQRFHHKLPTYSLDEMIENDQGVDLSDPHEFSVYEEIQAQWQKNLLYHAYGNVKERVEQQTWICFIRLTEEGISGEKLAAELGEKRMTVYQRKNRVLKLLQEEAKYLQEEIGDFDSSETQEWETFANTIPSKLECPNTEVKERFELLLKGFQNHPPSPSEAFYPQLLIITEGNSHWLRLTGKVTIGAHPRNSVHLKSEYISKVHCQLEKIQSTWSLSDCNSRNGTIVNGRKISQKTLYEGDIIQLSDIVLVFKEETHR